MFENESDKATWFAIPSNPQSGIPILTLVLYKVGGGVVGPGGGAPNRRAAAVGTGAKRTNAMT